MVILAGQRGASGELMNKLGDPKVSQVRFLVLHKNGDIEFSLGTMVEKSWDKQFPKRAEPHGRNLGVNPCRAIILDRRKLRAIVLTY